MRSTRRVLIAIATTLVVALTGSLTASGAVQAGTSASGTAVARPYLNIRSGPFLSSPVVARIYYGYGGTITCYAYNGDTVTGSGGTSRIWDYFPALGGYGADVWIDSGKAIQVLVSTCY